MHLGDVLVRFKLYHVLVCYSSAVNWFILYSCASLLRRDAMWSFNHDEYNWSNMRVGKDDVSVCEQEILSRA
jgi:hypothetical protein